MRCFTAARPNERPISWIVQTIDSALAISCFFVFSIIHPADTEECANALPTMAVCRDRHGYKSG